MTWMNECEIDDALARYADHRILGPATRTLGDLRDVVNANSDGWPYWPKPSNAARRLMELIQGDRSFDARYGDRDEVTDEQLHTAYRPLKAFRTRSGLAWTFPSSTPTSPPTRRPEPRSTMPLTADNALFGHTSPETAYMVDDYPYGRRVRCRVRCWIETVAGKGDRFVSQTEHPATKRWNAPRKSTYSPVGAMYLDDNGHVAWTALSTWASARAIEAFREAVGDQLLPDQARALATVSALHHANARMEAARLGS